MTLPDVFLNGNSGGCGISCGSAKTQMMKRDVLMAHPSPGSTIIILGMTSIVATAI